MLTRHGAQGIGNERAGLPVRDPLLFRLRLHIVMMEPPFLRAIGPHSWTE